MILARDVVENNFIKFSVKQFVALCGVLVQNYRALKHTSTTENILVLNNWKHQQNLVCCPLDVRLSLQTHSMGPEN